MADFLNQPRLHPLRRALFQIHLWVGVIASLYLLVVCTTGAALVFRSEMQQSVFPSLLRASTDRAPVDLAAVLASVRAAYPDLRVAGLDAPTTYRETVLAYVVNGGVYHTVLIDPASARVLGELPSGSWIATLQSLHFNLLMGRTGSLVNGIGALCLLALVLSGAVIWWQGRRRWMRGLTLRRARWPQVLWDLHSAGGAWFWPLLLMMAVTAFSLSFPGPFLALVRAITPTEERVSVSPATAALRGDTLPADEVIHRAQALRPQQFISRVVLPAGLDPYYQINYATERPTPLTPSAQQTAYFDRYSGQLVLERTSNVADKVVAWASALHVGNFAGLGIKALWAVLGLMPPLLLVTGLVTWWRRVVQPRLSQGFLSR